MNIVGYITVNAWECDHFTMFYSGSITVEGGRTWIFDGCSDCASDKLDEILEKLETIDLK